ncbi:MAG: hypothetical protein QCI38_08240, partial [Candidatus Thermoplasmatota archaeon]|nr:hypothetical protein [Candidatus Thermoplasmatota archaeon]
MKFAAILLVALALLATTPMGARADDSYTLEYTPPGYTYQYITGLEYEDAVSYNVMRITNTGTTSIHRISFSQQHTYWKTAIGIPQDTTYTVHGNTWIQMMQGHWVAMSVPAIEFQYTDWTPGTSKDFPMRVTNPTLPGGTYQFTMSVTITYETSLAEQQLVTPRYQPYAGVLTMGRYYNTGSGFTYPAANPGDLDITTTNTCIVYNSLSSTFPVTNLTFMLSDFTDGMGNTQRLVGKATILYESIYNNDWYEFPLDECTQHHAYVEVDLGGAYGPSTPPPDLAPGDNFAFKIRIDEL